VQRKLKTPDRQSPEQTPFQPAHCFFASANGMTRVGLIIDLISVEEEPAALSRVVPAGLAAESMEVLNQAGEEWNHDSLFRLRQ
jgi:hypothetical protein